MIQVTHCFETDNISLYVLRLPYSMTSPVLNNDFGLGVVIEQSNMNVDGTRSAAPLAHAQWNGNTSYVDARHGGTVSFVQGDMNTVNNHTYISKASTCIFRVPIIMFTNVRSRPLSCIAIVH